MYPGTNGIIKWIHTYTHARTLTRMDSHTYTHISIRRNANTIYCRNLICFPQTQFCMKRNVLAYQLDLIRARHADNVEPYRDVFKQRDRRNWMDCDHQETDALHRMPTAWGSAGHRKEQELILNEYKSTFWCADY